MRHLPRPLEGSRQKPSAFLLKINGRGAGQSINVPYCGLSQRSWGEAGNDLQATFQI